MNARQKSRLQSIQKAAPVFLSFRYAFGVLFVQFVSARKCAVEQQIDKYGRVVSSRRIDEVYHA